MGVEEDKGGEEEGERANSHSGVVYLIVIITVPHLQLHPLRTYLQCMHFAMMTSYVIMTRNKNRRKIVYKNGVTFAKACANREHGYSAY